MSLPLPDNFVDTGERPSLGMGCTLQLANLQAGFSPAWVVTMPGPDISVQLFETGPGGTSGSDGDHDYPDWEVSIQLLGDAPVLKEDVDGPEVLSPIPRHDSATYDVNYTAGPFRIGYRYIVQEGHTGHPLYHLDYRIDLAWFADESTQITVSIGDQSASLYWLSGTSTPPAPEVVNLGFSPGSFQIQANCNGGGIGTVVGELTGLSVTGGAGTGGYVGEKLTGTGAGAHFYHQGSSSGDAITLNLPSQVREIVTVKDTAGNDLGLTVQDADGRVLTTPVDQTNRRQDTSWGTPTPLSANRSWSLQGGQSALGAALPADDLAIPLYCNPPRTLLGDYRFYPVSINALDRYSVHRPWGSTPPSAWVPSSGDIVVTEHPTYTEVVVSATGSYIERTFTTEWRARAALSGTPSPATAYEDRKAHSGEDRAWWGSEGFQEWAVEAPAAHSLTLTAYGSWVDISDDFLTSGRTVTGTETTNERSYSVPVTVAGTAQQIDLLFPAEGGPHYAGFIRKLRLSGFQVGTYRINTIDQVAAHALMKCLTGKNASRGDYSVPMMSKGGSFGLGNWGDQAYKPDEVGAHGGGCRFVVVIESEIVGTLDTQYDLAAWWGLLGGNIEGWSTSWDTAAFDAATKDAEGNSLGGGLAQWTLPFVRALTPGTPYSPACSVTAGVFGLCAGIELIVHAELIVGGSVEGLAQVSGGGRAGAGVSVQAYDVATNLTLGAGGTTDADGFFQVHSLPAPGTIEVDVRKA